MTIAGRIVDLVAGTARERIAARIAKAQGALDKATATAAEIEAARTRLAETIALADNGDLEARRKFDALVDAHRREAELAEAQRAMIARERARLSEIDRGDALARAREHYADAKAAADAHIAAVAGLESTTAQLCAAIVHAENSGRALREIIGIPERRPGEVVPWPWCESAMSVYERLSHYVHTQLDLIKNHPDNILGQPHFKTPGALSAYERRLVDVVLPPDPDAPPPPAVAAAD